MLFYFFYHIFSSENLLESVIHLHTVEGSRKQKVFPSSTSGAIWLTVGILGNIN